MIFPIATKVTDPLAIVPTEGRFNNDQSFSTAVLPGQFRLLFPTTWPEIKMLQRMEHRLDKFAPAKEGGVLVTEDAFQRYTGRGDK